jgi:hypothetical protein
MKNSNTNENASYIFEQEKRQSRKQSQQLRQRKQSRKGMWCAE